jgi:hypothetical protein
LGSFIFPRFAISKIKQIIDGSYLFVISGNGMLIFDSEAGELLKSYAGVSKENIYSISISKDGRILATGG